MSCVKNDVRTFERNSATHFFLEMLLATFTCVDTVHFEAYDVRTQVYNSSLKRNVYNTEVKMHWSPSRIARLISHIKQPPVRKVWPVLLVHQGAGRLKAYGHLRLKFS